MGSFQGHCPVCRTYPRDNELHCRHGVQNFDRSNRLEVTPSDIQLNKLLVGSAGSGHICNSLVHSTPSFLQLETRPISGGNRCLQSAVGSVKGLRKPSMVPDCQGPLTNKDPSGAGNTCSSSLEGPTMVSSTAGNVVSTTNLLSEPVSVDVRHRTYGHSASTSRMAYLWQKFRRKNLSESAKELLLASWRNKTSKAYDSHFRKWLGWCNEQGCDPISGPISDVANFLADLHSHGYQTSSLNAYQSSVHDRVDDTDVGKHPLISRLLKGAFHATPPLPCYSRTWNVEVVLNCMQQWSDTVSLSLSC